MNEFKLSFKVFHAGSALLSNNIFSNTRHKHSNTREDSRWRKAGLFKELTVCWGYRREREGVTDMQPESGPAGPAATCVVNSQWTAHPVNARMSLVSLHGQLTRDKQLTYMVTKKNTNSCGAELGEAG